MVRCCAVEAEDKSKWRKERMEGKMPLINVTF